MKALRKHTTMSTKRERVDRVAGELARWEKWLCRIAERVERMARKRGLQPGICGHTPKPGGWWYRFDFSIPFTGTTIGLISGQGWRVHRPLKGWTSVEGGAR